MPAEARLPEQRGCWSPAMPPSGTSRRRPSPAPHPGQHRRHDPAERRAGFAAGPACSRPIRRWRGSAAACGSRRRVRDVLCAVRQLPGQPAVYVRRRARHARPGGAASGRCRAATRAWFRRSTDRAAVRAPGDLRLVASPSAARTRPRCACPARRCRRDRTAVVRSHSTVVSRWFVMPTPRDRRRRRGRVRVPRLSSPPASPRFLGVVLDQPERGKCCVNSAAVATTQPSWSNRIERELVVPWSRASTNRGIRGLCEVQAYYMAPASRSVAGRRWSHSSRRCSLPGGGAAQAWCGVQDVLGRRGHSSRHRYSIRVRTAQAALVADSASDSALPMTRAVRVRRSGRSALRAGRQPRSRCTRFARNCRSRRPACRRRERSRRVQ